MSKRYLIDTNVFLWWVDDRPCLSSEVIALMKNPAHSLFLSAASAWEMAIKIGLGKLKPLPTKIEQLLTLERINLLPITLDHIDAVTRLPGYHRDPFDRMLVAQAMLDDLTLVTSDSQLKAYGVPIIDAA